MRQSCLGSLWVVCVLFLPALSAAEDNLFYSDLARARSE